MTSFCEILKYTSFCESWQKNVNKLTERCEQVDREMSTCWRALVNSMGPKKWIQNESKNNLKIESKLTPNLTKLVSLSVQWNSFPCTTEQKEYHYYYYYIHATEHSTAGYYCFSICSSSLSLTCSCVSILTLQWLPSPHNLVQHGLSHDTLQWL